MSKKFRAGRAEHPRDNDPEFDTEADAVEWAVGQHSDFVLAVWAPDAETLALVFEGEVFDP